MRYDLKGPCKNCPFTTTKDRIVFADESRAAEIAESAYRRGFPCHRSAKVQEDEDGGSDEYVEGPNSQHCMGAIIMFIRDGQTAWPGVNNNEALVERIANRVNLLAPVFDSEQAFIDANRARPEPRKRRKRRG